MWGKRYVRRYARQLKSFRYYARKAKAYSLRSRNGRQFGRMKYAPTRPTRPTAQQMTLTRLPIFNGASKLIRNQLYYDNSIVLSGAIGAIPYRFYWANNVYDPYQPTGGHQAIGFDQMMALFEHYCTIRSKVTVNFHNATSGPVKVGIYLSPDAIPAANITTLMENGLVKTMILGGDGEKTTGTLSLDCDVKNYFGKTRYKDLMDDRDFVGDVSSSPVEGVYYGIFAYDALGLLEDVTVGFDILISYDTIYFEPKKLTPS